MCNVVGGVKTYFVDYVEAVFFGDMTERTVFDVGSRIGLKIIS